MKRLLIDDERFPPSHNEEEWEVARTLEEVMSLYRSGIRFQFISFDHDLGGDQASGAKITKWLVDYDMDGNDVFPEGFSFYVHSQNPVGKENIEGYLGQYLALKSESLKEQISIKEKIMITAIPGIELIAAASWCRTPLYKLQWQLREDCSVTQYWHHFDGCFYAAYPNRANAVDQWGWYRRQGRFDDSDDAHWNLGVMAVDDFGNLVPIDIFAHYYEDTQSDQVTNFYLGGRPDAKVDYLRLSWFINNERPITYFAVDEWFNVWAIRPLTEPYNSMLTRTNFSKELHQRGPFHKEPGPNVILTHEEMAENGLQFLSGC